jgi:polyhydroxyalkanoate synthesis regulator phasin
MIKLLDILEEGTLTLTPEERQQVEDMLPKAIKILSGKYLGDNMGVQIGTIDAISADKTPIKVNIYIANNLKLKDADGYFQTNDPKNPNDNQIFIQQFHFSPYFTGLSGLDLKLTKFATGNENVGLERLRKVFKHELIHAKDPSVNQHQSKASYSTSNAEIYYKSWVEFQSMTGQFFEAITTGVDRALRLGMSKDEILKALNNILEYYSGKTKIFSQEAKDFIQGSGKRNIFQSLINFFVKLPSAINDYAAYLANIKKYNPEGYKEFLIDLYKTIDQAKDRLKTLQEMQYINEAKRFQQLAGILNEEYRKKLEEIVLEGEDKNLVTDPRILALAAKITKQSVDKVEDKVDAVLTGKEEENKEEIKESLAITLTLALPMILEAGGSLAGWINKKYGLSKEELVEYKKWQSEYSKLKKTVDSYSDSVKLTDPKTKRYVDNKKAELAKMKQEGSEKFGGKISKLLKEAGHGLHSVYTSPIRALLWTISLFTPKGSDLRNPKIREKIANIIYAAGMIGFAGYGIFHSIQHLVGVSEAATAIIDGAKGGKSVGEIVKDVPTVAKAFAT